LSIHVTQGNSRVCPRSTWCSSCMMSINNFSEVLACCATKSGLTRSLGCCEHSTAAVLTSCDSAMSSNCNSPCSAYVPLGKQSSIRSAIGLSLKVVICAPPGE
jgi:hypothetical protein